MLSTKSLKPEWLKYIAQNSTTTNKRVEKAIWILYLLEGLTETDIDFVLKGRTALMLRNNTIHKSSKNIDIIVPNWKKLSYELLKDAILLKGFSKVVLHKKKLKEHIPQLQFRLYYPSAVPSENKNSLLLNIFLQRAPYFDIVYQNIDAYFAIQKGYTLCLPIPSYNDLLGEKLACFHESIPLENLNQIDDSKITIIAKQLYDVGILFGRMDNLSIVNDTFHKIALTALKQKNLPLNPQLILDVIFQAALIISIEGQQENSPNQGLLATFQQTEKIIIQAAKAAYLAKLIEHQQRVHIPFYTTLQTKNCCIEQPFPTKLNKLQKSNPEAFYYWFQACELG